MNNVLDGSICASTQNDNSDEEHSAVQQGQSNVLLGGEAAAFPNELEPEQGREVESEAGDEEGGDQTEQGVEEGNSLRNNPADDGDNRDKADPDSPATDALDIADWRVGECTVHDVATDNSAVDTSRNEDEPKEKGPDKMEFEIMNERYDSFEERSSELDDEVELQTPTLRRFDLVRRPVERYSPPDFLFTFFYINY